MCPLEAAVTSQIFQMKLNFCFQGYISSKKVTLKISPLDAAGCFNLQWFLLCFVLQDFQTDFKCNFNIDGGRLVNAVKVTGTEFIECDSITVSATQPLIHGHFINRAFY